MILFTAKWLARERKKRKNKIKINETRRQALKLKNISIIAFPGAAEIMEKLRLAEDNPALVENFYPFISRYAKTYQSPKLVGVTFSLATLHYVKEMSGLEKLQAVRSIPFGRLVDALVDEVEAAKEAKNFIRNVVDSLDCNLPMWRPEDID